MKRELEVYFGDRVDLKNLVTTSQKQKLRDDIWLKTSLVNNFLAHCMFKYNSNDTFEHRNKMVFCLNKVENVLSETYLVSLQNNFVEDKVLLCFFSEQFPLFQEICQFY